MANTDETGRKRIARRDRFLLAAAGIGLLGLLLAATMLQPSSSGHGTHRQLGLPPCTFWVLFGRPCPTCGMTTAWAHLVRGQWISACRANVSGALLGMLAMVTTPWLLASAWRGSWFGGLPNRTVAAYISTTILLVMLIDWGIRLFGG